MLSAVHGAEGVRVRPDDECGDSKRPASDSNALLAPHGGLHQPGTGPVNEARHAGGCQGQETARAAGLGVGLCPGVLRGAPDLVVGWADAGVQDELFHSL
jgi:hypothetical protein